MLGEPDLLIADEPTTALDVTVQAQILSLIRELHEETDSALILITHDLGVIAGSCERMLVMDEGEVVEEGGTRALFSSPQSEKARALLSVAPSITAPVDVLAVPEPPSRVLDVEDVAVRFRERGVGSGESLNAVQTDVVFRGQGRDDCDRWRIRLGEDEPRARRAGAHPSRPWTHEIPRCRIAG